MNRSNFINLFGSGAAAAALGVESPPVQMNVPDTPLAREATLVARSAEPIEVFNHSLRTFLFAELIAKAKGLQYDAEIIYVAAILHDTGLTASHMSAKQRFEVDGANLAREMAGRHGLSKARVDVMWDAIALHDQGGIASWKATEVMLVNAGVAADFGAYLDLMKREDIVAVLSAAPRTGFIPVFIKSVAAVAKQKPQATGNCFVTDVGYRMVPGFHLANFCDEVQDDPFAAYR